VNVFSRPSQGPNDVGSLDDAHPAVLEASGEISILPRR
jgi:hypothetical protein